jgi:hypothetical protein
MAVRPKRSSARWISRQQAAALNAISSAAPPGITVDGAGNLWVADYINNRVVMFQNAATKANGADADGLLGQASFTTFTGPAAQRDRLWGPRGLAVDSRRALWVTEEFNHRVVRFDGAAAAALANAADPAVNVSLPDGVIGQADFVTNSQRNISPAVISPWDVDTSAYGDIWVAQRVNLNGGHRVSRFTPDNNSYRSDAMIGANKNGLKGNQIYNLTGGGQKVTVFSENRKKVRVFAGAGNDGEYADDFRLIGPGSNRYFTLKYFATTPGKRNITGEAKGGGYFDRVVLTGQARSYLVEVKPKGSTREKVKKFQMSLGVFSLRGSSEDRVKGTVKTRK